MKVHFEPLRGFFWPKVKKVDPPEMAIFLKNAYLLSWSQVEFQTSISSYCCWVKCFDILPSINADPEAFSHP